MVYKGQELGKLGQRGNWINVQISDGRTGWIHKKIHPAQDNGGCPRRHAA
jgi:hypothetical protein